MKLSPVKQAANLSRPVGLATSWVIALFSLPIAYRDVFAPPPASATTPFSPASSARPPEPVTVLHPCACATRLLPLTHPSRVGAGSAAPASGAAVKPRTRSDTDTAARQAFVIRTRLLNQMSRRAGRIGDVCLPPGVLPSVHVPPGPSNRSP